VNTASGQEFVFDFLKANVTEVEKKFSMRSTNVHPCDAVVETKLLNHQGIVGVACLASLSNIQEVLLLGTAILKCGGIAVRVESSGAVVRMHLNLQFGFGFIICLCLHCRERGMPRRLDKLYPRSVRRPSI